MARGRRKPLPPSSSSSDSYSKESSASSASSSSPCEKQKQSSSKSKRSCESGKKDERSSRLQKGGDNKQHRGTEKSGAGGSHPAPDAAHAQLSSAAMYGLSPGQAYANGSVMGFGGYQGSGWPAAPPVFPPPGLSGGPPPPRPLPPGHMLAGGPLPPHTLSGGPPPPHMLPPHALSGGPPPPRPLPPGAAFPRPPGFGHSLPPAGFDYRGWAERGDPRAGGGGGSNDFHHTDDRSRAMDFGSFAGRDRGRNNKRDKPKWVPGQGRNPDLDAERKTGFGLGSAYSEHDDRRGEGDTKRKRAPSPSGSWKHDLFDEVMKSDAKDSKAKKRR